MSRQCSLLLLEDVWNLDDCDPLSLEPVSTLQYAFEYHDLCGRRFWFDAPAWFEWICVTRDNRPKKHPLTKVQLSFKHHEQIHEACLQIPEDELDAKLAKKLARCQSKMVYFKREVDSSGNLLGVKIHAESPLYHSKVANGRSFLHNDMRKEDVADCMIACTVHVFNCRNVLVNVCQVYV
jgi:hypothetical protein